MSSAAGPVSGNSALQLAPWPQVDFAAFGEIETRPLTRIQALTSAYLARNWAAIPHVFHQNEADATELELLWRQHRDEHPEARITALAFVVKAVALTLRDHPSFNASLDVANNTMILKNYAHIGVAVNTPAGLVVPVVRDCDRRLVADIASDIHRLSTTAREKGLPLKDMLGGCFTVSSLGKVGGTGFTPIINAPEVAILGISRLQEAPRRTRNDGIAWRQVMPLSLSYDHRANNGAAAGAFMTDLCARLANPSVLLN
jgi:pyruvate dehydrogenase E2 component (dihydrolipoamide acetyltransferase)